MLRRESSKIHAQNVDLAREVRSPLRISVVKARRRVRLRNRRRPDLHREEAHADRKHHGDRILHQGRPSAPRSKPKWTVKHSL